MFEWTMIVKPAALVRRIRCACLLVATGLAALSVHAQGSRRAVPLGDGPWVVATSEGFDVRVSIVTRGLSHPWGLAFLPNGDLLVTERPGRLRVIHDGVLSPRPIPGIPEVSGAPLAGLMDIALHPEFRQNGLVYFTYSKPTQSGVRTTLGRGRWDGTTLVEIEDVFLADGYGADRGGASRIAFDRDGTLFMTIGGAGTVGDLRAQDPGTDIGKVLRLRDDGGVPPDNPFVGQQGYKPEIYSVGHRNQIGLAIHPETGALWATEQGPQGGDELNLILPGRNYGWPAVTYGRNYDGTRASEQPWRADLEPPELFWVPSIAVTGMTFYTGDAFPAWKGNLFVGGMTEARIPQSGQIQRIVFNENGEIRREPMLRELRQRIRDVREGPDGNLYVLTDEDAGVLLRIEPVR